MTGYGIDRFIAECEAAAAANAEAADCVVAALPLMERLLEGDKAFLKPEHFRADPDHYARNAIYVAEDERMSLFALVWLPGQWTPVHDHGTWGVVGVVQGALEERSYMSEGKITRDDGIALKRGGVVLLKEKSVTSFVPNPDHIHMTGVPENRAMAVTLHLYGRNMNSFHIYDVAQGTRRLINVPHQKS